MTGLVDNNARIKNIFNDLETSLGYDAIFVEELIYRLAEMVVILGDKVDYLVAKEETRKK